MKEKLINLLSASINLTLIFPIFDSIMKKIYKITIHSENRRIPVGNKFIYSAFFNQKQLYLLFNSLECSGKSHYRIGLQENYFISVLIAIL